MLWHYLARPQHSPSQKETFDQTVADTNKDPKLHLLVFICTCRTREKHIPGRVFLCLCICGQKSRLPKTTTIRLCPALLSQLSISPRTCTVGFDQRCSHNSALCIKLALIYYDGVLTCTTAPVHKKICEEAEVIGFLTFLNAQPPQTR